MGRNTNGKWKIHLEPIVECMKCHSQHLRRERKKVIPEGDTKILSYLVCPKCGSEGYVFVGEKEVRRKKKKE